MGNRRRKDWQWWRRSQKLPAESAGATTSGSADPLPPKIDVKLPGAFGDLAKGEVRPLSSSLDPSKMTTEALMATMWVTLQQLVKDVDGIKRHLTWQMRIAVGGLFGIIGTLFGVLLHLAGSYLAAIAQHKP